MTIFNFLSLIGGLALFLFGMNVMGGGLEKMGGGKFESVLEKMTNNRIKGVLLGAGVTAVIQSSSAVTVMAVGFVNSGIMALNQVVGILCAPISAPVSPPGCCRSPALRAAMYS